MFTANIYNFLLSIIIFINFFNISVNIMDTMDYTQQLKTFFRLKGVSQSQVAEDIGVAQSYISSIFNGKIRIGRSTAKKLADKYGLSESWLITGQGSITGEEISQPGESNVSTDARIRFLEEQVEFYKQQAEFYHSQLNK